MGRNFVPISLLVTLELIRFIQSFKMMSDQRMRTEEIGCVVQTSNLNEELGMIRYVFSDKTGTLTCNSMVFKKLYVYGDTYGTTG